MQPLYDHYLQFIRSSLKNDTSFSGAIPEEEQASLAALAEEHRSGIWGHGSSFLKLHTDSRSMSCTGTLHILGKLFSGFWNCSSSSRAASTPIWRKS